MKILESTYSTPAKQPDVIHSRACSAACWRWETEENRSWFSEDCLEAGKLHLGMMRLSECNGLPEQKKIQQSQFIDTWEKDCVLEVIDQGNRRGYSPEVWFSAPPSPESFSVQGKQWPWEVVPARDVKEEIPISAQLAMQAFGQGQPQLTNWHVAFPAEKFDRSKAITHQFRQSLQDAGKTTAKASAQVAAGTLVAATTMLAAAGAVIAAPLALLAAVDPVLCGVVHGRWNENRDALWIAVCRWE